MQVLRALILSVFISISSSALAAPLWSIDYLGGAKYVSVISKSHPAGFGAGTFTQADLFGDGLPAIKAAIDRGAPFARYNLAWSDSHSFPRSSWPKIIAEARRVSRFVVKYPSLGCAISGATEHQLNRRDASDLAAQVLNVIPAWCKYVNNPWEGKGAFLPATDRIINEVHGANARAPEGAFSYSFDGSDAFDSDVTTIKNRLDNALYFFFWTSQANGRRNAGDTTPRPLRKFWLTPELVEALAFLATDQGAVSLARNVLLKPKSDQHEVPPNPRELKPVIIAPDRVDKLILRAPGASFTSSPRVSFADGRFRYYFPLFGYQMARRARTSVFELVTPKGKVLGRVNPGFRQGGFR